MGGTTLNSQPQNVLLCARLGLETIKNTPIDQGRGRMITPFGRGVEIRKHISLGGEGGCEYIPFGYGADMGMSVKYEERCRIMMYVFTQPLRTSKL